MIKIYYDKIEVGEIMTNRSITVMEALELIDFDETEFMKKYDFESLDYNEFNLEY